MIQDPDFFLFVVARLNELRIPYMVTGSFVSIIYGTQRNTNDVDIVIDPTREQVHQFVDAMRPECDVPIEAALAAMGRARMFSVVRETTGAKVDLIIKRDSSFEKSKFSRIKVIEFFGSAVNISTPEDVLLHKLIWAKKWDSELQLRDAASVLRISGKILDWDYMRSWAKRLAIEDKFAEAEEEAQRRIEPTDHN